MDSDSKQVYQSTEYPFITVTVRILESDLGPMELSCFADTGATDYDLVLFDKEFDETKIHQSPWRQYVPLAGSEYSLIGNQYLCTIEFGKSGPHTLTILIVKDHVKVTEALAGGGFLNRFISVFNGPQRLLEIHEP